MSHESGTVKECTVHSGAAAYPDAFLEPSSCVREYRHVCRRQDIIRPSHLHDIFSGGHFSGTCFCGVCEQLFKLPGFVPQDN
jgi:hypothetical protein